jgi:hypothetical protein
MALVSLVISLQRIRENARTYTDGSVVDERSGCAIVMGQREVKIRLARKMSIFNAERRWQAIIEAIKK